MVSASTRIIYRLKSLSFHRGSPFCGQNRLSYLNVKYLSNNFVRVFLKRIFILLLCVSLIIITPLTYKILNFIFTSIYNLCF